MTDPLSRSKRRSLLNALMVGASALMVCANCSQGSSAPQQPAPAPSPPPPPPAPPPASSSISIEWTAPVDREDGQPLAASEIAYFEIKITDASAREQLIRISDGNARRHEVEDLPSGSYSVSITATDTDDRQSQESASMSVEVP